MESSGSHFLLSVLLFPFKLLIGIISNIIRMFMTMLVLWAMGYGGLYLYLEANPEKKEEFDQKKAAVSSMLGQLGTVLETQEKSAGKSDETPVGLGAVSQFISPEMLQMAQKYINGDLFGNSQNNIPEALVPVDVVLQESKNYDKLRPYLTIDKAGEDGSKAVQLLGKLLGNKNKRVAEAAHESLVNINTEDAKAALQTHGY